MNNDYFELKQKRLGKIITLIEIVSKNSFLSFLSLFSLSE